MYSLDKDIAKEILVKELSYSLLDAELFLKNFPPLNEKLTTSVQEWLKDRTFVDVEAEGLTITELMNIHGYNFLLAVIDINLLLDESKPLADRKRLAEILHKPHIIR